MGKQQGVGQLMFRELYLKILLSVLGVIVAMLLLEGALNQLKLRALVAEATSSRHQISASKIQASVIQAEALGFAIDEMTGLQDLLEREREKDPSIVEISIVSPIGAPLLSTGTTEATQAELDNVLRRFLGTQEKMSRFDAGERLYTGRLLFDSSEAIMGAIVITSPTEAYLADAQRSFVQMRLAYLSIFLLCATFLVPFVMVQFAGLRQAFGILDPHILDAQGPDDRPVSAPEAAELLAMVHRGSMRLDELERELVQLTEAELPSNRVTA